MKMSTVYKVVPIEIAKKLSLYQDCQICFHAVRRKKIAVMKCCGFKLCKQCLYKWCARSMTCPHCRDFIHSIKGCHKEIKSKCCTIL